MLLRGGLVHHSDLLNQCEQAGPELPRPELNQHVQGAERVGRISLPLDQAQFTPPMAMGAGRPVLLEEVGLPGAEWKVLATQGKAQG